MQRVVVLERCAALAGDVAYGVVDVAVGAGAVLLALVRTERAAGGFEPVEIVVGEHAACGKYAVADGAYVADGVGNLIDS